MFKAIKLMVLFLTLSAHPTFSQDLPKWGLRVGYSPRTEDVLGFGAVYRPTSSRWFHQLELYLIQNRGSDITLDAKNLGGLFRTNYIVNKPTSRFHFFVGAEVYAYRYSRRFPSSSNPSIYEVDAIAQIMGQTGVNYRFGKRVHINVSLPVFGAELSRSSGGLGESSHTTPAILGLFGFFQPRFGIEVGLF